MTTTLRPPTPVTRSSPLPMFVGLFVALPLLLIVPARVDGSLSAVMGGLVTVVILAPLVLAVARKVLATETDDRIRDIVMIGLAAKLIGVVTRYYVTFELFNADAVEYHAQGVRLAPSFRSLDFVVDLERGVIGTGFIRAATGVIYAIFGANRFGGFVVYGALAMIGTLLFFRAFRLAVPNGDARRYALLLFLLPSLLFWPSSIGKESWMLFTLGVTALGMALALTNSRSAFPVAAIGLGGTALVRPHVSLIAFGALAVAYALRRTPIERRTATTGATKLVGLATLVVAGGFLMTFTQEFFGAGLGTDSLDEVLEETSERSSQGGSEFDPIRIRSPIDFPEAALTVLFRPLPFEADNAAARIAAAEGTLLLLVTLASVSRLRGIVGRILATPYVAACLVFVVLFVYAFAVIGNFGLLARQRSQLMPFLLVLLALPKADPVAPAVPKLQVGVREESAARAPVALDAT